MTEQAAGLLGSPVIVPESDRFLHNQRLGLVMKKPGVPWTNEFLLSRFQYEGSAKRDSRQCIGCEGAAHISDEDCNVGARKFAVLGIDLHHRDIVALIRAMNFAS